MTYLRDFQTGVVNAEFGLVAADDATLERIGASAVPMTTHSFPGLLPCRMPADDALERSVIHRP